MSWAELSSLTISLLALAISSAAFWLTLLRRGDVRMTSPTVVYFGPDAGAGGLPKLFLRTLLYSTSPRGRVVEQIWVRLRRGETQQNFSIWVYGDEKLSRGSGLFVGPEGVAANRHFLLPKDTPDLNFYAGDYVLEVHAEIAGDKKSRLLHGVHLSLPERLTAALKEPDTGVYFDWGPDSRAYHAHAERKPIPTPDQLKSLFDTVPRSGTGKTNEV